MNYAILTTVSLEGRRQAMDSSGWVLQMNLCYLYTDEVEVNFMWQQRLDCISLKRIML